jgi:type IV secretory pathway VirB6-like protein
MGLINDLSIMVDKTLSNYSETVFTGVADPIRNLLGAMALLALMLLAVNHLVQFRTINYAEYFHWFLRYVLVYSFSTIWANFEGIYNIFKDIPSDYVAMVLKAVALHIRTLRTDVLDPSLITSTTTGIDEFGHAIVWIAYDFLRDTSINNIGMSIKNILFAIIILIIGGIFIASSAILVLVSKIGLALAVSLSPLAITMLMMEQTKQYFGDWLKFTVSFAVIPLLTGALLAIVLYVAGEVLTNSGASSQHKNLWFGFIFIMVAVVFMLQQIPTMASTLASATVAAVGAGAGMAAASMVKNNVMGAPSKAWGMASKAYSGGQRLRDAAGVARAAHKSGASIGRSTWSAISGMRQSAIMRQDRRDRRLAGRIAGNNGPSTAGSNYKQGSQATPATSSGSSSSSGGSTSNNNPNRASSSPGSASPSGGSGSNNRASSSPRPSSSSGSAASNNNPNRASSSSRPSSPSAGSSSNNNE